jgi:hypothetical protein
MRCAHPGEVKLVNARRPIIPEPAQSTGRPPWAHPEHSTRLLDTPQETKRQNEFLPQWPAKTALRFGRPTGV